MAEEHHNIFPERVFKGHHDCIHNVAISSDGNYIATASDDKTAKIWNIHTGKEVLTCTGHVDIVFSVVFTPTKHRNNDSRLLYLVTGSYDSTAILWEVNLPHETATPIRTFKGHSGNISCVVVSIDDRYLITGSSDNTAKRWNLQTGEELQTFVGHTNFVTAIALSLDGRLLVTGSADDTAKLWDVEHYTVGKNPIVTFHGHSGGSIVMSITAVALSVDSKYLVTGAEDGTVILWDVDMGSEIRSFRHSVNSVNSIALSPNSCRYVITGSGDHTAKLWDLKTGKSIQRFVGHKHVVTSVAVSSDGQFLVTSSWDETASVWKMYVPDW
eukprot:CAMPEP_0195302914 /NCGR_PEP_ID=MMETSP0707-20130614/31917_1 /TAXON_ID=33640 /ORGANISM="Asterionellopsis glacialis, Strain CCMP134" /LENGTH=326 /DNA_ID=CAMNT_0040366297 /DNA_START=33 /DNA_END=1010 /DNA_ORIENTATION=-